MNLVFQHEIISDDLDDDKYRYIAANNNNCNLKGMLTCHKINQEGIQLKILNVHEPFRVCFKRTKGPREETTVVE